MAYTKSIEFWDAIYKEKTIHALRGTIHKNNGIRWSNTKDTIYYH